MPSREAVVADEVRQLEPFLKRGPVQPFDILRVEADHDTALRHPAVLLYVRHDDVVDVRVERRSLRWGLGNDFASWYFELTTSEVERMPREAEEGPGARRHAPYTREAPDLSATQSWIAGALRDCNRYLLRHTPVRLTGHSFQPPTGGSDGWFAVGVRHGEAAKDRLMSLPAREQTGQPLAPLDAVQDLQSNLPLVLDRAYVDRLPPAPPSFR